MSLDRMAEKSSENVLEEIKSRKTTTLARLLFALGIRHVGETGARLLAEYFKTMESLHVASIEQLEAVDQIGPEIAQSVRKFFLESRNAETLSKLMKAGVRFEPASKEAGATRGKLAGKTFVFTGTMENFTRNQAKDLVQQNGGVVSNSVGPSTDYVVAGTEPGSKAAKAKALGVTTLSEKEFKQMVKG